MTARAILSVLALCACQADVTSDPTMPPIVPTPLPDCTESMVMPPDSVEIYTLQSGAWSDPGTWNLGRVPAASDDVAIRRCHVVTYDRVSDDAIHTILVNGKLEFAPTANTRLVVGILAVSDDASMDLSAPSACAVHGHEPHVMQNPHRATLSVGSAAAPIAAANRAEIRLAAFPDLEADCAPAIISHAGRMDFYGAPMDTTWTKLGADAGAGSMQVVLAQAVEAWKPGDEVIVTATSDDGNGRSEDQSILRGNLEARTELRRITAVSGNTISLDAPLVFDHRGGASETDFRGEVGNLSRNVVVESVDPDGARGHVMYHHGSSGNVHYAELRHLGKAGALGRYALHYHVIEDTMRGSSVIGASIWDSDNRWITVHGTEYLVVRDLVAYQALGHGLFLEDASEVYNLFDHSLLVQSFDSEPIEGQVLAYDLNKGGCYWAANARNWVTDSTFVECDNDDSVILDYAPDDEPMPTRMLHPDGSRQTVNAETVSGGLFDGIEVHSHRGWGPWIKGGHFPEDEPMVFRNTRVWNVHYSIDISGANVVFDGVEVAETPYGFYNLFPGSHVVRNAYMHGVSPHGAFMFYRGGGGTMFYEDFRTENCLLTFRIDALNEPGPDGEPIVIHARNFEVVNPMYSDGGGSQRAHWVGTEDMNSRPDPIVMLVMHDLFGPDRDAIALPGNQSPTLPGVPEGLSFVPGSTMSDADGVGFAGRGETWVAEGNVPFPADAPILNPVDRVPPATIITSPAPGEHLVVTGGTLVVRGVVLDQNGVAGVKVNGVDATIADNGRDWSVTLTGVPAGGVEITATSTDSAGNVEAMPHTTHFWVASR